jgi:hypothetical protein
MRKRVRPALQRLTFVSGLAGLGAKDDAEGVEESDGNDMSSPSGLGAGDVQ